MAPLLERDRVAAGVVSLLLLASACAPAPIPSGGPTATGSVEPSTAVTPSASPSTVPSPSLAAWRVTAAAPMLESRDGFRAIVLGDGTLLVAGNDHACTPGPAVAGSETTERYDATSGTWTVAPPLNKPRKGFAMVPTIDGGAMVIGGANAASMPFSSTKRLDPGATSWVDGPLLPVAVADPGVIALDDGRIVVIRTAVSGETSWTSTIDVLEPGAAAWSRLGRIDGPDIDRPVVLADGRIAAIAAEFETPPTVIIIDPSTGAGRMIVRPRLDGIDRIIPLGDGGFLAVGELQDHAAGVALRGLVDRFDPVSSGWVDVPQATVLRAGAQWATLEDGRVLVAGGVVGGEVWVGGAIVRSTETFDPETNAWTAGPELLGLRTGGVTALLADGSLLVMGGADRLNLDVETPFCPGALTSVERLYPAP